MWTSRARRRPLAIAALIFAALFVTTGVTASAAPATAPSSSAQTTDNPSADRYLAAALSPSTHGRAWRWSSSLSSAQTGSLDTCNLHYSGNTYDCVSAGYTLNGWLAIAVSRKDGPWGYSSGWTATEAGKNALGWCKYYGGGNDCHVIFNKSAKDG